MLKFADDIVFLAKEYKKLEKNLNGMEHKLNVGYGRYGMKINKGKIKVIVCNRCDHKDLLKLVEKKFRNRTSFVI